MKGRGAGGLKHFISAGLAEERPERSIRKKPSDSALSKQSWSPASVSSSWKTSCRSSRNTLHQVMWSPVPSNNKFWELRLSSSHSFRFVRFVGNLKYVLECNLVRVQWILKSLILQIAIDSAVNILVLVWIFWGIYDLPWQPASVFHYSHHNLVSSLNLLSLKHYLLVLS